MNTAERTRYLLENNGFMAVATADAEGKPWVSPVGFVYDDSYSLYWVSARDALHSRNIALRPQVAISIFGQMPEGDFDGVYVDGEATELADEVEIQKGIDLFAERRPQPDRFVTRSVADVMGAAAWRMYRASPLQISIRTDATTLGGQAITVREPVELLEKYS